MERKLLKTALFGYSKTGVCEYIASVNEDFSRKLLDAVQDHKIEKQALNEKIATLEEELAEYKRAHSDIAAALLEAQQYAAELKQKAEEEDRQLREESARLHAERNARLDTYSDAIDKLRRDLAAFAAGAEEQLADFTARNEALQQEFEDAAL